MHSGSGQGGGGNAGSQIRIGQRLSSLKEIRSYRLLPLDVRALPDLSEVTRLKIAPKLMASFCGTDNLGYDSNSPTGVIVTDT